MRDVDNLDRKTLIVSALIDKPEEWVDDNLSLAQCNAIISKTKFIDELPTRPAKARFILGGRLWKIELNPAELVPAQFVDLSILTKTEGDVIDNMHKILAVLCWPHFAPKKYDSKKSNEYAELFYNHMPVDYAYGVAVFFCDLLEKYLAATMDYLDTEIQTVMKNLQSKQEA